METISLDTVIMCLFSSSFYLLSFGDLCVVFYGHGFVVKIVFSSYFSINSILSLIVSGLVIYLIAPLISAALLSFRYCSLSFISSLIILNYNNKYSFLRSRSFFVVIITLLLFPVFRMFGNSFCLVFSCLSGLRLPYKYILNFSLLNTCNYICHILLKKYIKSYIISSFMNAKKLFRIDI